MNSLATTQGAEAYRLFQQEMSAGHMVFIHMNLNKSVVSIRGIITRIYESQFSGWTADIDMHFDWAYCQVAMDSVVAIAHVAREEDAVNKGYHFWVNQS